MSDSLNQFADKLSQCMASDRHALQQALRRIEGLAKARKPFDQALAKFVAQMETSIARRTARLARLPVPAYPEELPVSGKRDEILAALEKNQVVIICGETGSGKTTQIPKICLDLKRGAAGVIGCTQPRRIAARSVASRIAQELNSPLGQTVGFKVRFTDKVSDETAIKVMTDGILLAESQSDRYLSQYDTIIVDEAHERSLNIDFLLGFLRQLLPKRPDLKVIITSATIDAERFSKHFNNAPVIEVSGRLYPVEIRYRPVRSEDEDDQERDTEQAIVDAVDDLSRISRDGDILIFLPGEREIRDTAEALRKHHPGHTEILPLYARLTPQEQDRVFKPSNARRIILATNVAETSLTVPGIRYVIDPGHARIMRYSYRNKVDMLQVEKTSQASANQRAGRCGRVASGICVRLYDEEDFQNRPRFTDPEILRTSLAGVILRMKSLHLGDVESFPFLDAPTSRMIADGYQLLSELNAVDENNNLTETGKQLARLPIDPKVGRMLLAGNSERCLTEMLIIASALSVQDPRLRPMESAGRADDRHRAFADERSDFIGFLKLWQFFDEALKHKKSNRKLIDQCHEHFLSYIRLREWRDIHGQLHAFVTEMGMRPNEIPASYEEIHRALLTGLLGNIGIKAEEGHYQGARDIKFQIFPGSALHKKNPKWVVAAELTETGKLYGRAVAKIEPEWVERVGKHLLKRSYFDPHWEKGASQVVAFERLTLYGLIINPRRKVHYGPIDPKLSRELFIRQGLVEGQFVTRAPFFAHNQKLVEEVRELEHKSRRPDVLVDEERMFEFYDKRIPAGIHNGVDFEKWRREAEQQNKQLLYMAKDDLMRHGAEDVTVTLFPETIHIGPVDCPLTYRFEPGHPLDGVTLTIPLHLLNQVNEARCDWLVPGMIREKVTWLVKALPKNIRRVCVPVPEFVTEALIAIKPGELLLTESLSNYLRATKKLAVSPDEFDLKDMPAHLRMNFRVVDDAGAELGMNRNLLELKQQLGQAAQVTFARAPELDFEKENITQWDFGDLPEKITFNRDNIQLTGYPALVDEQESVSIRLFDTSATAQSAMRSGVRRLLRLNLKEQMKQLEKSLPGFTQMALQARGLMTTDEFKEDLIAAITDRAFINDDELPRNQKDFNKQRDRAKTRLPAVADGACKLTTEILDLNQQIQGKLSGKLAYPLANDIRSQLSRLVYPHFLSATPWEHLQHLPRYLKAILRRIEKYPGNADRGIKHTASLQEWWQRYEARAEELQKAAKSSQKLDEFRWMLEELRVSLFAQELKTPYPISYKRLEKAWDEEKA